MKKNDYSDITWLLVILTIIMLPVNTLLEAHTLRYLWHWFVIPVFKTPALPILYAAGILFIINFISAFTSNPLKKQNLIEGTDSRLLTAIIYPVIISQYFMFVGWILQAIINR